MADTKVFRIKNRFVFGLADFLGTTPLAGKESRERTKFIRLLSDHLMEVEKDRLEIIKRFTPLGPQGEPKTKKDATGKEVYDVPKDKSGDYDKEYNELMDEEFVLDILEGNKSKFETAKKLVLETTQKFGPSPEDPAVVKEFKFRQAAEYVEWCEAFEVVK